MKNISLLINAYEISKLVKNDIFLVILGNGPDIRVMKKKVNSLGLGGRGGGPCTQSLVLGL